MLSYARNIQTVLQTKELMDRENTLQSVQGLVYPQSAGDEHWSKRSIQEVIHLPEGQMTQLGAKQFCTTQEGSRPCN